MLAILFALIALVGWGTGDIFGGLVSRKIGGYSAAFWSSMIGLIISTFYIPFAIHDLALITPQTIIWLIILTPVGAIPLISLYEAIRLGNASLNGTIAGAFGGLVAILSVLFLKESINILQVISIIAMVFGLVLSTLDFKTIKLNKILSDKGIPFALVSLITWGFYFTFIKIPINNIGWFWSSYIPFLGLLLILIYFRVRSIKLKFPKDKNSIIFMLLNGIILTAGGFAYNIAASRGFLSVVAPIASSYPVLFAVLAYFVFKDRLTKQQIVGVIITLLGIVSLSLMS